MRRAASRAVASDVTTMPLSRSASIRFGVATADSGRSCAGMRTLPVGERHTLADDASRYLRQIGNELVSIADRRHYIGEWAARFCHLETLALPQRIAAAERPATPAAGDAVRLGVQPSTGCADELGDGPPWTPGSGPSWSDVADIQDLYGHTDPETTMICAPPQLQKHAEAIARLQRADRAPVPVEGRIRLAGTQRSSSPPRRSGESRHAARSG